MSDVKPYTRRFTFKNCGRTALHVVVHPNREDMYSALDEWGYKTRTGRAVTTYEEGGKIGIVHFTRRCVGSEVVAHESVHAAAWLISADKRAKKFRDDQESLAFWTGQIMRAIVSDFYDNGIYK